MSAVCVAFVKRIKDAFSVLLVLRGDSTDSLQLCNLDSGYTTDILEVLHKMDNSKHF